MKIDGMREKHVLREATRDVIIPAVYDREKHPFTTPPAKVGENDSMLALYNDVFGSPRFDEQPIFDPVAVRSALAAFDDMPDDGRIAVDGFFNRVLSFTLMHERFGMSAE